ncbi:ADP-ribose pyrophosphatase [Schinkia azotoformans MEV2011]|uniref:ADP-ribose pyrophosphatase n=1 Tax=Schinkia azotoformans MEV2011 TaxID=1348973 RepID=A0A072NG96_SCHAZ|nr:NUDIX domain-containing protein [Schinkia azotoformans]KEF35953.1 ADP-ribose pyrophosphatase [Schinkia azotoformans MEV2011]KEF39722.1 ADP-ribose pyrophosphatase [Schinkia azotoformans MEV2011]MEC1695059.1 NUDIX domain-containing protein [Schinkia azotoformans]MEC1716333.1 NUDIX domain-containing protein [Schinkia azotoformans]MEC1726864.1 NUDIX domain-containing protein [Schinkia azotoformans]
MFYRREMYRVWPEKLNGFNKYFHEFVLPNQVKNGARLVGRWVTEGNDEVVVMWEYPSFEEYFKIEERVLKDDMYKQAEEQLRKIGPLFEDFSQAFLKSTGIYNSPMQSVTVSGYITNEKGEVLLVQTYWRADTWELPGGRVDEGETLDAALYREIYEETGIKVKLQGVTGVYSNGSTISIVFRGSCAGGELSVSDETKDVRFVKIDKTNLNCFIRRGKFFPRVLDAMEGNCVPYEAFKVRPYELLNRIGKSESKE